MLNSFARKLASFFIAKGYLKEELLDWYIFTLEKKFVAFIGLSWLVTVGTALSDFLTTVVFITGFYLLRSRAGGYHARSFGRCLFLSTLTVLSNIYVVTPLLVLYLPAAPIILSTVCFLVLQFLGTVAHPSVQLTECEMTWQCIFMRLIAAAQFILIVGLVVFGISATVAANLSSGMGFVAISSVIGKMKIRRQEHGEESIVAGVQSN